MAANPLPADEVYWTLLNSYNAGTRQFCTMCLIGCPRTIPIAALCNARSATTTLTKFRVVWIKAIEQSREEQVGVVCIEPGKNPWGVELPTRVDEYEEKD